LDNPLVLLCDSFFFRKKAILFRYIVCFLPCSYISSLSSLVLLLQQIYTYLLFTVSLNYSLIFSWKNPSLSHSAFLLQLAVAFLILGRARFSSIFLRRKHFQLLMNLLLFERIFNCKIRFTLADLKWRVCNTNIYGDIYCNIYRTLLWHSDRVTIICTRKMQAWNTKEMITDNRKSYFSFSLYLFSLSNYMYVAYMCFKCILHIKYTCIYVTLIWLFLIGPFNKFLLHFFTNHVSKLNHIFWRTI